MLPVSKINHHLFASLQRNFNLRHPPICVTSTRHLERQSMTEWSPGNATKLVTLSQKLRDFRLPHHPMGKDQAHPTEIDRIWGPSPSKSCAIFGLWRSSACRTNLDKNAEWQWCKKKNMENLNHWLPNPNLTVRSRLVLLKNHLGKTFTQWAMQETNWALARCSNDFANVSHVKSGSGPHWATQDSHAVEACNEVSKSTLLSEI